MFRDAYDVRTPSAIVLILVCIDRGDQYLFIDTKTKSLKDSVTNIYGGCCNTLLLDIAWLDEG